MRERYDDFARLSRLVQQSGRGSLSPGHSQTVCLLPQRGIDIFMQGISAPGLTLLSCSTTFRRKPTLQFSTRRIKIFITSSKITWLALHPLFLTAITRKGSPSYVRTSSERPVSTVSIDRRIRCQRAVLVVSHARHADGMVHATKGRERLPTRIGAAVGADGCGMVDLGIRTNGSRQTTSDQRSREENWQTSRGRVVQ